MTIEQSDEAWVLLKPEYDYIAIPLSLFGEAAKHMKRVKSDYSGVCTIADKPIEMSLMTSDTMKAAMVKHRMLGKDGE